MLVYGFRRGGQFVAKKYADSPTTTTTKLIESISDDGLLAYRIEREYWQLNRHWLISVSIFVYKNS